LVNHPGAHAALRFVATIAIGVVLSSCSFSGPTTAALPSEFPADFPKPPSAKLITATGPLPFVPAEVRTISVQWSSTLSKADLVSFYSTPHGRWAPYDKPVEGPGAGPITLGTVFLLRHDGDGMTATVSVGMTNAIDKGTLVQATILPPRAIPSPTP
jgi:hypothetical protein